MDAPPGTGSRGKPAALRAPVIYCHYCGRIVPKGRRHVDHMTPLSRRGAHAVENLAASCQRCNSRKFTKTAEEFDPYED